MLQERNKTHIARIVAITICLLGFFLRLYFYLIDRSLWQDEATLALNIVNRSFLELLKPLDYNQGAPIGFLFIQKAVVSTFGISDLTLRLIPLFAGLAAIPFMYYVSKLYLKGLASFISLGLFALSTQLIYYSSELKQYSSDVLMALLLLLIFPKCLEEREKHHGLIAFGIVVSLAMWISQPTLFVSLGIYFTLGLVYAKRKEKTHLIWLIGIGGLWGINLIVNYLISLRYLATNNSLINYWNGSFAPLPPWSNFNWYYDALFGILRNPAILPATAITIGLLILGIVSFALRKWQLMIVLTAPFLLTLGASALRKYPFSGRLLLFFIPLFLLLLAEGVERVRVVLITVNKPLALIVTGSLVIYFFYNPIIIASRNILNPPMGEDIKPVMTYVSKNFLSGDLIYVYHSAEPAFEFYAPQFDFVKRSHIVGISSRQDPSKYLQDIDNLRGNQRVWFIFSHNCPSCGVLDEQVFILDYLNKVGTKRGEFYSDGASVYLYNMTDIP